MEKVKVKMLVDDRENDKIFRLLGSPKFKEIIGKMKVDLEVEKARNLVGDFVVLEKSVCIERKAFLTDFIPSVRSKHLQFQLLNMQNNFNNNYLLISGNVKDVAFAKHISHYSVNEFVGSIASFLVRYNTKLFMVNNDTQLLKLVLKIVEKTFDTKIVSDIVRIPITKKDRKIAMLGCIEGLGAEKAKELASIYSIRELCTVTEDELMKIKGIGKKLSNNIINVFS